MIKSLNSASSQVWAFLLVLLGISSLVATCFCHGNATAMATLLTTGGNMVVGGIAMFQHQPASQQQQNPPPAVDPIAPPSAPVGAIPKS